MQIRGWSDAAFRLDQEIFERPLEFIGKIIEHHAQSPSRKFLMLTFWPSIAHGRIPNCDRTFTN